MKSRENQQYWQSLKLETIIMPLLTRDSTLYYLLVTDGDYVKR